ncbi:diacylglycerol/lipid kinase family protein [Sphingomonas sp. DT-204]|uniref:diacylglycerol/lipid kinase family protein n=1 Tax=Sphingomonas sp. DT-204 TaxID=3396166 RepID=UPI003F1B5CBB
MSQFFDSLRHKSVAAGSAPKLARTRGETGVVLPWPGSAPARARRLHGADEVRAGVIANARAHRNRKDGLQFDGTEDTLYASPRTRLALERVLVDYAAEGVNLLIVDGGDGTVRDVITAAGKVFAHMPKLAVIPSGKTNALAYDLGIPEDWTVEAALEAARADRFGTRAPVEIARVGAAEPELRGFLFGAGGFVRATELAQRTHKWGAFNGVAVGLSLAWSIAQTLFGSAGNAWRQGERMRIRLEDGFEVDRAFYILFLSTLERMPLGLKPFGRPRPGLKGLAVDAPPRSPLVAFGPLLTGSEASWLDDWGYHRADPGPFELTLDGDFVLDGEQYRGGALAIRAGAPLQFAVP